MGRGRNWCRKCLLPIFICFAVDDYCFQSYTWLVASGIATPVSVCQAMEMSQITYSFICAMERKKKAMLKKASPCSGLKWDQFITSRNDLIQVEYMHKKALCRLTVQRNSSTWHDATAKEQILSEVQTQVNFSDRFERNHKGNCVFCVHSCHTVRWATHGKWRPLIHIHNPDKQWHLQHYHHLISCEDFVIYLLMCLLVDRSLHQENQVPS